jgi:hypothetical protein
VEPPAMVADPPFVRAFWRDDVAGNLTSSREAGN